MRVSIIVATCGDQSWSDLAWSRAMPSAKGQTAAWGTEIVCHHYPELSVSGARNVAAAHASGDWLCFLDADDELEAGYLDAMRAAFMRGAITTDWSPLLVPAVRYVGADAVFQGAPAIPNRGGWPRVNECVIGTLIRRTHFVELGGFREFPSIEDYDLFLRAYDAGSSLVYVPEAVYRAHVSPGGRNLDQSSYPQIWADHEARIAAGTGRP